MTSSRWQRIGVSTHMKPRPGVWPVKPERMSQRQESIDAYQKKWQQGCSRPASSLQHSERVVCTLRRVPSWSCTIRYAKLIGVCRSREVFGLVHFT